MAEACHESNLMKNGKFSGYLLASDYDNTLVDRKKRVPERTLAALRYFTENGGCFTLASGRSIEAVRLQLPGLPVNAPVVASNGTQVYDYENDKLLYEKALPEAAKADFKAVLDAFPKLAVEIYAEGKTYVVRPNEFTAAHLKYTRGSAIERKLEDIPSRWIYARFEQEESYLARVKEYFLENFGSRYEVMFSVSFLLEVIDGESGKGPGVLRLAELLGIEENHILCAGDNENDLSMLRLGGLAFVPEHSAESAMALADHIVCDCDEGSVADIVEYLDGNIKF